MAAGERGELRKNSARACVLISSLLRCGAWKESFATGAGSSRRRKWSSSGNSLPSIPAPTGGSFRCDYARRGGGSRPTAHCAIWSAADSSWNCSGPGAWSCRPRGMCIATPRPGAPRTGRKSWLRCCSIPLPWKRPLRALRPLEFQQVRRTPEEPLFNYLVAQYHPLGYARPVGEHLKYLVYAAGRLIACLAWSSAPRHLGARDRFIGWSAEARRRNIRFLAYNPRYLILPWVRVPHLASHVLGQMARRIAGDWERVYGHPIYFLETFVDPERYRGTCYRAANWVVMGRTTGRGKNCPNKRPNRSIKEVLGYPLTPRFRELLAEVAMKPARRGSTGEPKNSK